uniref:Uncharacterized protein n=1 Tax=uncultured bacterium Contig1772 TaxID=1393512 RepID=W0FJV3_9BACT|nr:hypothetical protein [uncultured bacterium Contig1772]
MQQRELEDAEGACRMQQRGLEDAEGACRIPRRDAWEYFLVQDMKLRDGDCYVALAVGDGPIQVKGLFDSSNGHVYACKDGEDPRVSTSAAAAAAAPAPVPAPTPAPTAHTAGDQASPAPTVRTADDTTWPAPVPTVRTFPTAHSADDPAAPAPAVRIVGDLDGETGQVTVLQPDGSYRRYSRWDRINQGSPAQPDAILRTLPQCGCGGSIGMPKLFDSFAEMSAYFFCTFYLGGMEHVTKGPDPSPTFG